jgi:hypothetical protein
MYLSYNAGSLRCFPALPLYASLIRDQKGAADTARPVRLLLHLDGTGSRLRLTDAAIPVAQLA